MATIQITLPDGAIREVPSGTTAAEVARNISPSLAKEALVARVDGELADLSRPLDRNVKLAILTRKDPDALQVFRHSAAHLMAAAVLELFPDVKLGIGPPIENGFFYEFLREQPFTPEDLARIEKKMHELAATRYSERAQISAQAGSARALPQVESGIQMRIGGRKSRRADGFVLHHREIH